MGVEGFGNVRSISRFCECDLLSIDSCVLYSSGVILCCTRGSFPWRKHACKKVVRFRCDRRDGNMNKRHISATGNTCFPSCLRNGVTYFRNVSASGFLKFRPVWGNGFCSGL